MSTDQNPLLSGRPLPTFSALRSEHVVPAVQARLEAGRRRIAAVTQAASRDYASVVAPLEAAADDLDRTWAPVRHLHAVADSPEWREAYNACLPELSAYHTELGQNEALHAAYVAVAESPEFERLSRAQRKAVEDELRDFRLSGIDLAPEAKARFKTLSSELSALGSRFAEHVLDATQAWRKHVEDPGALAGLPSGALELAAEHAAREGLDGWMLTLDLPLYTAVMSHAEDRALRREVYVAYSTRASEQGPHAGRWDNTAVIEETLAKRHELATLVGFESYAEYSLERKMAESPAEVEDFLTELAARSKPVAEQELEALRAFASEGFGLDTLEAWDVGFVSERLREARYDISQETLRPYFPLSRVLEGLFEESCTGCSECEYAR